MRRGEIYVIELGPGIGHEASGTRPVVVVSDDVSNEVPVLVAVVPATASSGPVRGAITVPANRSGHPHDLAVSPTQVRVVDARRFLDQAAGTVPNDLMVLITFAVKVFLDIP